MDALTDGDMFGLVMVYGYVLCVLAVAWLLRHKVQNQRKIVHILTGGIVFFWWSFDTREVMAGLAAFPFVILLILATPKSPVKFLRRSPFGTHSSEGHPYGLVMYAISWTVIAYFLFEDLFAASIAIASMSFGDGMGELIGRRYGRLRYANDRSFEGSLAVFFATIAIVLVLCWFYFDFIDYSGSSRPELVPFFAIVIGALVALLEAVTPGEVDNLVIPLMIGGFLHIMGV